ncbi:hypothetical protein DIE15_28470 [Burkholderia sp. Bp9031]|nr:hypothetical protein DIE15_28470 [Burkholderia sp. Bp9031]
MATGTSGISGASGTSGTSGTSGASGASGMSRTSRTSRTCIEPTDIGTQRAPGPNRPRMIVDWRRARGSSTGEVSNDQATDRRRIRQRRNGPSGRERFRGAVGQA